MYTTFTQKSLRKQLKALEVGNAEAARCGVAAAHAALAAASASAAATVAIVGQKLGLVNPTIYHAAVALKATGMGAVELEPVGGRPAVWQKDVGIEYAIVAHWKETEAGYNKETGRFDVLNENDFVIAENVDLMEAVQLVVWRVFFEELTNDWDCDAVDVE